MKINKLLFIALLLFIGLWLHHLIGFIHYLIFIIIVVEILVDKSFIKIIKKNKDIVALFFVVLISYIYNLQNMKLIAENHAWNSGNYQPMMYFLIIGNSIILFFFIIFSYSFGYKLAAKPKWIFVFFNTIKYIFLINSIIVIASWISQTGGVISRYNFISPIDDSPSLSASFAVWGTLITLTFIKKESRFFTLLSIIIFAVNIIIVITRMTQVLYIISIIYFYILNINTSKNKQIKYILLIFTVSFLSLMSITVFNSLYSEYYYRIFSENSADILSRESAIQAAIEMFEKSPIFGVGYGIFGTYNMNEYDGTILASAHNGFFSILSELGIAGIIVCLFLVKNIVRITKNKFIKISDNFQQKVWNMSVVNLRMVIILFLFANFTLLPPANERNYYFSCAFMWLMYGFVQAQYNLSLYKTNINTTLEKFEL